MGARGPARKPTELLKKEGSWRGKAREKEGEVTPLPALLPPEPDWEEGPALEAWRKWAPGLVALGVLTEMDWPAFESMCQLHAVKIEAHSHVYNDPRAMSAYLRAEQQLRQCMREFGMTPSARSGLSIGTKKQASGLQKVT
jgi:phage terminase small subunit